MDKFERINGQIDISDAINNRSMYIDELEQVGARPKFWLNNYKYLFKETYELSYENYGEVLAQELAKLLGFECAEYDLAIYEGKKGVLTKNFVNEDNGEELIAGTRIIKDVFVQHIEPLLELKKHLEDIGTKVKSINDETNLKLLCDYLKNIIDSLNIRTKVIDGPLKNQIYAYYNIIEEVANLYNDDFIEMKNGIIKSNNLYDIWNVLELYATLNHYKIDVEKEMNNLINMFFFDIIVSNGDRHADNWSIIIDENNVIRLAPLYDNSSFCQLNREKTIENIHHYTSMLFDPNYSEVKKKKIDILLKQTISHSNSGVKTNYDNIVDKSKNDVIFNDFIDGSSKEFISKIQNLLNRINDEAIDHIFQQVHIKTGYPVPEKIQTVVRTVIKTNTKMMINIIEGEYKNDKRFSV